MQQSGTGIGCTSQKVFVSELMLRVGPLKNSPAVTQERTQVEYVQAKLPWSKTLLLSPSSASRQLCCLTFLDVGLQVIDRQLTRKLPHLTDQTSAACLASSSTSDSPHILQDLLRAVVRTSRSSSAVCVMRVPHAHADWLLLQHSYFPTQASSRAVAATAALHGISRPLLPLKFRKHLLLRLKRHRWQKHSCLCP